MAFSIFKMAVVPMLLHNAEMWGDEMNKRTVKLLDKLQLKYIRIVTGMGKGCPIPLLLYHTGMLSFFNRILICGLSFLRHVATLPLSKLARDTYETMSRHQLPGLATQLTPVIQELGLSNIQAYSKYSWKQIVKKKIVERQKEQLLQQAETYKKISAEE